MTELSMKERDFKCKFIGKCTTTHTVCSFYHTQKERKGRKDERSN